MTEQQDRRAQLRYTAGDRVWEVDVPLESDTLNSAVTAMPGAIKKMSKSLESSWFEDLRVQRSTRDASHTRPRQAR